MVGCGAFSLYYILMSLVSVRKVVESYEPDVIQESYHRMEDKTDVDIRKPWFL